MVALLISSNSIMSASVASVPFHVSHQAEAVALGSRLEAATEALLRAKDQVIAALDRQVIELQQLHRALAYAPIPVVAPEPQLPAPCNGVPAPHLFELAPQLPATPPPLPKTTIQPPRPVVSTTVAADVPAPDAVNSRHPISQPTPVEATLDPALERATLEELNEALASAFASVSSRCARC